jgi:hypothetical protein
LKTPAVLGRAEIEQSGTWIAAHQRADGLVAWTPGGPADPWNHVEAAMALDVAGREREAARAYEYLLGRQAADGSLAADLTGADKRVDTNAVAYLATGVLHHSLSTASRTYARRCLPFVERALGYVLDHRLASGAVAWNVDADGTAATAALVAASSSVALSLRAGSSLAAFAGAERPGWIAAAASIDRAIVARTGPFLDKSVFAMDWYYPVLAGAVEGRTARAHLAAGARHFVTSEGVRCRSDARWVTSAESAEAAIAYARAGDLVGSATLLATVADKRGASGGYLTGLVYPERSQFPPAEESTYSAAAVVLAADLLAGGSATGGVFAPVRTSTRKLPHAAASSSTNVPDAMASR